MSNSIFTICRKALRTVARSVAPFSATPSQVRLGRYNVSASADLFRDILTTGPWLFIRPASGIANGQTFNGDFQINVDLLSGFAADASNEFTDSDDILALLIAAFTDYSQWVKGKGFGPISITWGEPETIVVKYKPSVMRTKIVCTFRFVADAAFSNLVLNGNGDVVFNGSNNLVFAG